MMQHNQRIHASADVLAESHEVITRQKAESLCHPRTVLRSRALRTTDTLRFRSETERTLCL
jgi:hypothetical protein